MSETPKPSQDPWAAFGRIGGGVLFYGAVGFFLDRWLDTSFIVGLGIVIGAGLGTYAVMASLRNNDAGQPDRNARATAPLDEVNE
ncbi:hypothetical protein BH09ACT10_BH09ACT10_18090 [soil metagenome]